MKKYLLPLLLVIISHSNFAQSEKQHLKTIEQFLIEEYPKNEPGAAVLIAKNGEIIFEKAYGLASLDPKRKLKKDMVFQIASMTKQFVSAAILQLVEEGKMSLSDTIQKYVSYYPTKTHPITIHHLLSQTSGIPNYFDVDDNEFYLLAQEHTPQQLIHYYKDESLTFKPGSKWSYSNSNYPLLGAALEKVTGQSLKDYLRIHIFEPLGMTSSGLWYPENIKKNRIPVGYNEKNGKVYPGPKIVGSALYAPGGIVSTVQDLLLWNRALVQKTVISEFVVEQLTTEKTIDSGEGTGYGYGFFIKNLKGSPTIQHGGNLFGYTSSGLYLPNEDLFICILANRKFDRTEELANYLASVLLNNPIEIFSKKEISKEQLQDYIGIYELQSEELSRTFEIKLYDNQLLLSDPKAPANDAILTPSDKDIFILKAVNASFKFQRNEKGQVTGYEVIQGETFVFKKVK
ncbi:serine hydrolase [Dokdonia pacifica]|uniref:CubicO group peptidase, beta-lactamase class C family n=1 Tax=Dokdonia pacifica TaxID=1627892 RepID=A0A239DRW2_9FLAO|nr:serine hydrolase domain-containing protein [Dokdonia pacifica]GGG40927.1 serine hydrolase [Dokdonia pacifica]SNS35067.1 CubicO group peptidase, beta-lactamase class C family [Dokdonia pacifica]